MIEILVMIAMLPVLALSDWFQFVKRLPPLEADLARASHGAALVVLAGLAAYVLNTMHLLNDQYIVGTLGGTALFGLYWFCIGAPRVIGYRNPRLSIRALTKIAVGVGAGYVFWKGYAGRQGWWPEVVPFIELALAIFCVWCTVTGTVKWLLLLIGGGNALRTVERQRRRQNAPLRPVGVRRFLFFR